MTSRVITAITDLLLAGEALLIGGLLLGMRTDLCTSGGMWALAMVFLGLSALTGGIDHGFFELPEGNVQGRVVMQKITWLLIGVMTFLVLFSSVLEFVSPRYHVPFMLAGALQFAVFTVFVLRSERFLVVILNYLPVILLFLALNLFFLDTDRGNMYLIVGILVSFLASAVQIANPSILHPLDGNGLYHLIMMIAVVFFYYGGKDLI